MKQKQSQKVIVNINQAKAKRRKRAKKSAKKKSTPLQAPFYSPMPQPVIRYYDNTIPQRNITFNPPVVEQPKILQGVQAETEHAQPIRALRKPIKILSPLPETEHDLLRDLEPVTLGGEEAPSARDIIEEQPEAPVEAPVEAPIEKQKKKEKRVIEPEYEPTFTQPKFAPIIEPQQAEEDQLQKARKQREPEASWYKKVKADFKRANEKQRRFDMSEEGGGLDKKEADRLFERRRNNYIASLGADTTGFTYVTPPNAELSGGGFSFV
jgi:hypothetical protein